MLSPGRPLRATGAGEGRAMATALGVLLLGLAVSSSWERPTVALRTAYAYAAVPVRAPLLALRALGRGIAKTFGDVATLGDECARLRDEVGRLTREAAERHEVELQNERLRRLLDFRTRQHQVELTAAAVVGRDPHPWRRTLLIDKGSADGVGRDDPVLVTDGVVGRVVEVYRSSARVLLLQDLQSSIGAMLQRTRSTGDAQGTGEELLVMRNLPLDAGVKAGDAVVTSGMSTFYPKGLQVGTVASTRRDDKRLDLEVRIRPSADLSRCEEVLVMRRLKATSSLAGRDRVSP